MSQNLKWITVIATGFVLAGLLGAQGPLGGFWGAETSDPEPSGGALVGLVGAGMIEGLAFGVGLGWILFGRGLLRSDDRLGVATHAAVAWALVSWAPHTSFHQSISADNWGALAAVEWAFHVTLIVGAFTIALFVWRTLQGSTPGAMAEARS